MHGLSQGYPVTLLLQGLLSNLLHCTRLILCTPSLAYLQWSLWMSPGSDDGCVTLCTAALCCAMLCCVLLHYAVLKQLCCAALSCTVLCCAVLCCAVLCCAVLCCIAVHSLLGVYTVKWLVQMDRQCHAKHAHPMQVCFLPKCKLRHADKCRHCAYDLHSLQLLL